MRPPCFRLRTLLVAVAVVGAVFGVEVMRRRRAYYLDRASGHFIAAAPYTPGYFGDHPDPAKAAFHEAMRRKYERAAARPWLPVAPDPPPPD